MRSLLTVLLAVSLGLLLSNPGFAADNPAEIIVEPDGFSTQINDLDFSPNGQLLAAAAEASVRVYDVKGQTQIAQLWQNYSRAGEGACQSVRFSPDGRWLVVGVYNTSGMGLRIYQVGKWNEIAATIKNTGRDLRKIEFSTDGNYLLLADIDGTLSCWDWQNAPFVRRIKTTRYAPEAGRILSVLDSYASGRVFAMKDDGPALFTLPNLTPITTQQGFGQQPLNGWAIALQNARPQNARKFRLDLQRNTWGLISGVDGNFQVDVWSVANQTHSKGGTYRRHPSLPTALAIHPGQGLAASGDLNGEIHLWSNRTGAPVHVFRPTTTPIKNIAFAPTADDPGRIVFSRKVNGKMETQSFSFLNRVVKTATHNFTGPARTGIQLQARSLSDESTGDQRSDRFRLSAFRNGQRTGSYLMEPGYRSSHSILAPPNALGCRQAAITGSDGLVISWDTQKNALHPTRSFTGIGGTVTSLAVSPDRKYLLGASDSGEICLWNLSDFTQVGDLPFREIDGIVDDAANASSIRKGDKILTIDRKNRLTFYEDILYKRASYRVGQVIPVSLERRGVVSNVNVTLIPGAEFAEPLLHLLVTKDNEWVLYNPKGYYDSLPGADRMVGWLVSHGPTMSAEFFPVQRFRKLMNKPRLLDEIWKQGDVDLAIKTFQAQVGRIQTPDPNRTIVKKFGAPKIEITSPNNRSAIRQESFTLEGVIHGQGDVWEVFVRTALGVRQADFNKSTRRFQATDVPVHQGQNEIEVFYETREGVFSNPAQLTVQGLQPTQRRDLYVLAVGISQFEHIQDVKYLSESAGLFLNYVQKQSNRGLYKSVNIDHLADQEATRDNIRIAFRKFEEIAGREENASFMIYFCSHGLEDKQTNEYCLCTHDADPKKLAQTGITGTELQQFLTKIRQRQTVLFLDTCKSGKIQGRVPHQDLSADDAGLLFYAACSPGEEGETLPAHRCTLFTHALLQTCTTPDADKTGVYEGYELDEGIRKVARNHPGRDQNPISNGHTKIGKMPVFEYLSN